ncbi:uncharacterized protein LOC121727741 [Aricia agestis]|uniref:uncharacterized protein LOC121727741 n=1 Tax=Aricia agestis TaxID=91739 RepID=UPI001C20BECA|nr:uncharacterized protein LOC121727741 [Aricia agestis]
MDLTVDEFLEGLFSKEAHDRPSDEKNPDDSELTLPVWFDKKKYEQGRRFFWDFCFTLTTTMMCGLIAVFAVPSILKVLIGSRRSSSPYTAYKRYVSTILHTMSWFEHELYPGSTSWKSLATVRSRHFRAGQSAKLKGQGIVSQRDLALTQFGFIGFSLLKSDEFTIRQLEPGDWDAYLHFWRTIGHAIGIEDRYNICRKTVEETRQVCQVICDRVYTPCLTDVPEYFEHMARVLLEAMTCVNPTIDIEANLFLTRYLANVPGYILTERDRVDIQRRIVEKSQPKTENTSDCCVEATDVIQRPLIEVPHAKPLLLHWRDFETVESSPAYKRLPGPSRYRISFASIMIAIHSCFIGRIVMNWIYRYSVFLIKYFPYLAFFKYGIRTSYVNIFVEDPTDDTELKPNSAYATPQSASWFRTIMSSF